jgi:hypothetical protein
MSMCGVSMPSSEACQQSAAGQSILDKQFVGIDCQATDSATDEDLVPQNQKKLVGPKSCGGGPTHMEGPRRVC